MHKGTRKLPKTLAGCADRLYELKADKAAAKRVVEDIEAEESAIREHLIATLPKSEATGVSGKTARVTLVTKLVPQVEDWDKVHEFVRKTGSWDLLQRRISVAAVNERLEDGRAVPGVVQFQTVTVSLNKVS